MGPEILSQTACQHDPDVGPFIPRPAPVVAENGLDGEAGGLEASGESGNRQRPEREVEGVFLRSTAPTLEISLLKDREVPLAILTNRFDERQMGAAGRLSLQLNAVRVLPPVRDVGN